MAKGKKSNAGKREKPAQKGKKAATKSTAQQLAGVIQTARQIMRKDKGLNSDIERLPMLTWLMFLKFLDDMERMREEEAVLAGEPFRPAIEAPYRWRDWVNKNGFTGPELLAFVNQERVNRPDGTEGLGLLPYLKNLQGKNGPFRDRRDVIAAVFRGATNKMESGYLLRELVDKLAGIHFTSSDEIHTLSRLYETMLRETRDAAGDSGEFYTPRPVVQLMVQVTDPRLGDTVLDPACGTGGFLAEAFTYLERQCKTIEDRETLQTTSVIGGEAKTLPYLLAQMNLLLHGLEVPRISTDNSLAVNLKEIADKDRVSVILTNPPFGGEEERGILANFPPDRQTTETALLFLQLIMRKLRRVPKPGRAAVVVPNGTLFGVGVADRIKHDLLTNFNLHTVVRLPKGVFAPYTDIESNLLFFDTSGRTETIWYYEHQVPDGRRQYTKTKPLRYDEFSPLLAWWENREESEHAWQVRAEDVIRREPEGEILSVNLDVKNPNRRRGKLAGLSPRGIYEQLLRDTRGTLALLDDAGGMLAPAGEVAPAWTPTRLGDVLDNTRQWVDLDPGRTYSEVTVKLWGRGVVTRGRSTGAELAATRRHLLSAGQLVMSRIDARQGAFGVVPAELHGAVATNDFLAFTADTTRILPSFLGILARTEWFIALCARSSEGTTNRVRLKEEKFLNMEIPLPPVAEQQRIVDLVAIADEVGRRLEATAGALRADLLGGILVRELEAAGAADAA